MNLHDADRATVAPSRRLADAEALYRQVYEDLLRFPSDPLTYGQAQRYQQRWYEGMPRADDPDQRWMVHPRMGQRNTNLLREIEETSRHQSGMSRRMLERQAFVVTPQEYYQLQREFGPYNYPENGDRLQVMGVRIVVSRV